MNIYKNNRTGLSCASAVCCIMCSCMFVHGLHWFLTDCFSIGCLSTKNETDFISFENLYWCGCSTTTVGTANVYLQLFTNSNKMPCEECSILPDIIPVCDWSEMNTERTSSQMISCRVCTLLRWQHTPISTEIHSKHTVYNSFTDTFQY